MLHVKIIGLPVPEKKICEVFTIYGPPRPSWSFDLDHLYISLSPFPWRLHMKLCFDWPSGFREMFENGGHIHLYSPGAGADPV